jgi:hypothetical protein
MQPVSEQEKSSRNYLERREFFCHLIHIDFLRPNGLAPPPPGARPNDLSADEYIDINVSCFGRQRQRMLSP